MGNNYRCAFWGKYSRCKKRQWEELMIEWALLFWEQKQICWLQCGKKTSHLSIGMKIKKSRNVLTQENLKGYNCYNVHGMKELSKRKTHVHTRTICRMFFHLFPIFFLNMRSKINRSANCPFSRKHFLILPVQCSMTKKAKPIRFRNRVQEQVDSSANGPWLGLIPY